MMLIMSFPILLWSFKLIPHLLVGFWRLWLFNYPLYFTLAFHTLNPMNLHETKVVPSLGVLIIHVQYFSSIRWGNPNILAFHCGYWNWSLMGERVNGPIVNYKVSVRINLDLGMSQVVLVLDMISGTWFSVARGFICREEMHEAFIRLEKLHCRSGLEGERWAHLARIGRCWSMDNDNYYYEVVFLHRGFPREIIVSILWCCLSDLFLLAFIISAQNPNKWYQSCIWLQRDAFVVKVKAWS